MIAPLTPPKPTPPRCDPISPELEAKYAHLQSILKEMGRVVVAFSAGIDSTLVLKVALDTLGPEKVLAATGVSPSLPSRELQSVRDLASLLYAPLELMPTSELDNPNYAANPTNRCYYCKTELYTKLTDLARSKGFNAVLNGVNLDDQGDYRPGLKAASEWSVRAPLHEAGFTKADVRALARHLDLPNWEKPALACLSSRIPYGTPVMIGSLAQIEKAEAFLYSKGLTTLRVRHHSTVARIEVPTSELPKLIEEPVRTELVAHFKLLGYKYVTLDLQGFRSGSNNEVL